METEVTLTDNKVRFSGKSRNNPAVIMNYFPPFGDGEGYTGLEMLLLSFSGCSGTAVTALLRKMGKTMNGLTIRAKGQRQDTMPMAFRTIDVMFSIHSPDVTEEDASKVLHLAETSMCPVWAMIRGNVEVRATFQISR